MLQDYNLDYVIELLSGQIGCVACIGKSKMPILIPFSLLNSIRKPL